MDMPHARYKVGSHFEIWPVRSDHFKTYLAERLWDKHNKAPGSEALNAARNVLEMKARKGKKYRLENRVAWHNGAIYYDMTDENWRAVKITPEGWNMVDEPPILFRRYSHQAPQVEPVDGGKLKDFLRYTNLRDRDLDLLLLIYTPSCLYPGIPHPIPIVYGPQGSAKTTSLRMIRWLIDPSKLETLSLPRNNVELEQQLSHHWIAFYDNLSGMPLWASDALCRAVTGAWISQRTLYTDNDDSLREVRTCVGLNGINIAADRPDLLDRSILFALDPIPENERKAEKQLWEDFKEDRSALFGAILDALSRAMSLQDSIQVDGLSRMADFEELGCALAIALGGSQQDFLSAYKQNTNYRNDEVLADSVVAQAVMAFGSDRDE